MAIKNPLYVMNGGSWVANDGLFVMNGGAWTTIKEAWVMISGAWTKVYDYTTNAILYGTSTYAFTPNGSTVYQQTGLYAGYGVPSDWNQSADGVIIYNGVYDDSSPRWVGKAFTIPSGCTSIRIKCTCDNGGAVYLNQTNLGSAPHMSWAYYTKDVVPNDIIYISLVNYGGSKYNGEVIRVDDLTNGGTILKTDTSWIGG